MKSMPRMRFPARIARRSLLRLLAALLLPVVLLACNLTRLAAGPTPAATTPAAEPLPAETLPAAATPGQPAPPALTPALTPGAPALDADLRVVFIRSGNLALWQNGQVRALTQAGQVFRPLLSADGERVAFVRPADDRHIELWVVNTDGSDERRLVSVADLDTIGGGARDPGALAVIPLDFAWVGQTHSLAFNTQQTFAGPGISPLDDLHLVDADSGAITNVFLGGWGGAFSLAPDGRQVMLVRPDQLLLTELDGDPYTRLMDYPAVITYSEYRYYAQPQWAPDGSFVRLALPPADPLADPPQPTTLWRIVLDGAPEQEGSIQPVPFFAAPVAYAPDLAHIAFLQPLGQPNENRAALIIAAPDGGAARVVAEGEQIAFLGWSPDSRRIIFSQGELQAVWIAGVEAANELLAPDEPLAPAEALAGAQFGGHAAQWLDAERLLLVQQQEQTFRLLLVQVGGGVTQLLTFDDYPVWSAHLR